MQEEFFRDQRGSIGSFSKGDGFKSMISGKGRKPSVFGRKSMHILSPFMGGDDRRATLATKGVSKQLQEDDEEEGVTKIFDDGDSEDF